MLKSAVRVALTLLMFALAIFVGYRLWAHYMYSPWTRDGRVRADVVAVAPDVAGLVVAVPVRDNQAVRKGDVLFIIDTARYQLAIAQAEAALSAAHTDSDLKRAEARRRAELDAAVVSRESRESTQAIAEAAAARVKEAEVALSLAQLNLERASVRAPTDGYVTNLNVHVGDFAVAGHPMLAVVDAHTFHVEGYFEETKLTHLHIGDIVDIALMSGDRHLQGKVVSLAHAIADPEAAGLLSAVNPTFHWVRLAQRIPVRIDFNEIPKDTILAAGMTCTLTVHPHPS
jgi:RND family efflux transporter MFP subunit